MIYSTSCKSPKLLTTETLSHGVLLNFSRYLRDSVVEDELNKHFRLHMQEIYFIRSLGQGKSQGRPLLSIPAVP
jgi:hypothetical protein